MHNFNGEDRDGGGNRSRKRSGEVYATDPPRPSTFLEGDFNMVMDDQCQFYCDAKHTMRECEQLKRALGVPLEPKKAKSDNNDDQNSNHRYDNRNCRPDRRDYCDRRPYRHNDDSDHHNYRRDYHRDDHRDDRFETTTAATIIVKTAAMTGVTTVVTTAVTAVVMIVIAKMTTTARNTLHHRRQKGATPMARFSPPTGRLTLSLVVDK
jgi:hypothetical protein